MKSPQRRAKQAQAMREWRAAHPPTQERRDELNAQSRARWKPRTPEQRARSAELQQIRRKANPERTKAHEEIYRKRHPDRVREVARKTNARLGPEYFRAWHQRRKATIIERYGGVCACCGETELAFLSIDHVNGGGHQERRRLGSSGITKMLLASVERLPGYRVLCMNCQFGTHLGRTCPHQLI